jgi:hypothetical protein
MMERAVVNEDAVNTDLPLVRNAGEPSVLDSSAASHFGAASRFVLGLAAAQALAFGPRAALTRVCALLGVALIFCAAIFRPVLLPAGFFSG